MTDPIQQQLIENRRNQILDATTKVFAEKGYHPTTIKQIAQEAGIADGTIYNYFKNKPALLLGVFDRMRASIQQEEAFLNLTTVDLRTFMKAFLRHPLMVLKTDNFALFRVVISEMMVNAELRDLYYQQILEPTIALAEQQFKTWEEQGLIKPMNVKLSVRAISGMVMGLMMENIMGDPILESQWDDLPDFLTDLLLNGLEANQ